MQVEGRGLHRRLAEHHVNLPSMMRLVVEEVKCGHWGCFYIAIPLIVDVGDWSLKKSAVRLFKECHDACGFFAARRSQISKPLVENGVQRRCCIAGAGKPR